MRYGLEGWVPLFLLHWAFLIEAKITSIFTGGQQHHTLPTYVCLSAFHG